jgi:hypothetical protein
VYSLNRFYKLPSRRTIVRAIDDVYKEKIAEFMIILESIPGRVALTCDGWSSRIMRGYFVVTLHWICNDWRLRSSMLEFRYFPSPHNAVTTSELLNMILRDYNIHTRIRAITSDSGSEMAPAMNRLRDKLNQEFNLRLTESFHIRCVCHVMNRAAVDAERVIKDEVGKVRELLKVVRATVRMREEFAMIQVRLGSRRKLDVPNLDVENRWNSMFEMVKNCYDLRHVFESLCNTDEFQNRLNDLKLSDLDWRELKSVTDFLEVMAKYTTASSGQSVGSGVGVE